MTKRRELARQDLKIGECKCDFVSEYEVFDVAEGEILVSKQAPGRISDGYARVFSTINGWHGMPFDTRTASGEGSDEAKKKWIKSKCKFIGIAVTGHKTEKIAKFDQGFVACISGIVTVMNEGPETLHPGALLTWQVCDKYPIQHGIHARKVRFRFAKAKAGDEIVGKVLSYSKKGSTVDILLHPVKSR